MKKGQLTKKEKEYILSCRDRMTAQSISAKLDRPVETVRKFLDAHEPTATSPSGGGLFPVGGGFGGEGPRGSPQSFRESAEWGRLGEQFSKAEMEVFEEKFSDWLGQFRANILPTERNQLVQAVKLDLLMDRNMIARKKALEEIDRLEKVHRRMLEELSRPRPENGGPEGEDEEADADKRVFLLDLGKQLDAARQDERERSTEFVRLMSEHTKLIDKLKASREQRIKDVETGKVSYLSLLKLLQRRENAEKEGRLAELFRMAGEGETERLSGPHTYMDGSVDLPILMSESIEKWAPEGDE